MNWSASVPIKIDIDMYTSTTFTPFSMSMPDGRLVTFGRPQVMGILNVTPDSFYGGSRSFDSIAIEQRVSTMLAEGVDIIDIGGYSSRPGATHVSEEEELRRLSLGMDIIRRHTTSIPVSVDTFRAEVARKAISEMGADIVNDISGGNLDEGMWDVVASVNAPYILMHMRGNPENMMDFTEYEHVTRDVLSELGDRLQQLAIMGIKDIVIDPGFGFSKTLEQNYALLKDMPLFHLFHRPILVGVSRKSMITKLLSNTSEDGLIGSTAINTIALMYGGASILRVHDVAAARQVVEIVEMTRHSE